MINRRHRTHIESLGLFSMALQVDTGTILETKSSASNPEYCWSVMAAMK